MPTANPWALAMIAIVDSAAYQQDTEAGQSARLEAGMAQWSGLIEEIGDRMNQVIQMIKEYITPGPTAEQRAIAIISALGSLWSTTFLEIFPWPEEA